MAESRRVIHPRGETTDRGSFDTERAEDTETPEQKRRLPTWSPRHPAPSAQAKTSRAKRASKGEPQVSRASPSPSAPRLPLPPTSSPKPASVCSVSNTRRFPIAGRRPPEAAYSAVTRRSWAATPSLDRPPPRGP
jgi:hypothetical protein